MKQLRRQLWTALRKRASVRLSLSPAQSVHRNKELDMLVRLSSALFVTTLLAACGDAPSSSPEGAQAPAPGQIAELSLIHI